MLSDKFDKNKLRGELERIRLYVICLKKNLLKLLNSYQVDSQYHKMFALIYCRREQIDEDAREIRVLTERFVEEEDSGQERERKFRWKHLNNGDMDDGPQNIDQDATGGVLNNSDDENEVEWRRIRYEREQLLKQQIKDNDSVRSKLQYNL